MIAGDGLQALQCLDAERFCLALVDLDMPKIDGYRLISLIRGSQRYGQLRIIVVTSSRNPDDVQEAIRLGANGVQHKPVEWSSFIARIAKVLSPGMTGK